MYNFHVKNKTFTKHTISVISSNEFCLFFLFRKLKHSLYLEPFATYCYQSELTYQALHLSSRKRLYANTLKCHQLSEETLNTTWMHIFLKAKNLILLQHNLPSSFFHMTKQIWAQHKTAAWRTLFSVFPAKY